MAERNLLDEYMSKNGLTQTPRTLYLPEIRRSEDDPLAGIDINSIPRFRNSIPFRISPNSKADPNWPTPQNVSATPYERPESGTLRPVPTEFFYSARPAGSVDLSALEAQQQNFKAAADSRARTAQPSEAPVSVPDKKAPTSPGFLASLPKLNWNSSVLDMIGGGALGYNPYASIQAARRENAAREADPNASVTLASKLGGFGSEAVAALKDAARLFYDLPKQVFTRDLRYTPQEQAQREATEEFKRTRPEEYAFQQQFKKYGDAWNEKFNESRNRSQSMPAFDNILAAQRAGQDPKVIAAMPEKMRQDVMAMESESALPIAERTRRANAQQNEERTRVAGVQQNGASQARNAMSAQLEQMTAVKNWAQQNGISPNRAMEMLKTMYAPQPALSFKDAVARDRYQAIQQKYKPEFDAAVKTNDVEKQRAIRDKINAEADAFLDKLLGRTSLDDIMTSGKR